MIKGSYNYHVNEGIRAHCNQVTELYLPGNSNFPWTNSSAADCNRLVAKVPRISHIFFLWVHIDNLANGMYMCTQSCIIIDSVFN